MPPRKHTPFSGRTHPRRSKKKSKRTLLQLLTERSGLSPDGTRDKASPPRTQQRFRLRSLAASSAVTAERDARAGFQIDATGAGWQCACVVPRRGRGVGVSQTGGEGRKGHATLWASGRTACRGVWFLPPRLSGAGLPDFSRGAATHAGPARVTAVPRGSAQMAG